MALLSLQIMVSKSVLTATTIRGLPLLLPPQFSSKISQKQSHQFSTSSLVATKTKTEVDGIKLHWKKYGNGPHVALCLPGLAGSILENFGPVVKKMNLDKFTLIAWDPPGYGESRPPEREILTEEFCLSTDARLAYGLMKKLGYDKYSLIGWSNGGATACLLGAHHPEAVHRIVKCNTPVKFVQRSVNIMEVMVDLDTWTTAQRKALLRTYEKPYALKLLRDWKTLTEKLCKANTFDKWYAGEMSKITAPLLYIKGMDDIIVPTEDVEYFGTLVKNFKLHKVAKGGHNHIEFLDEFVTATEKFLLE